jgi:DNA-binding CsgD family transcriptional regulator
MWEGVRLMTEPGLYSRSLAELEREGEERLSQGNVASRLTAHGVGRHTVGPRQLRLVIPTPARYDRRRSIERRRRIAYSGPLPSHLAQSFTPAEVAVLRIIADEHRDRGECDRSIDEIAARAGACRRTVQNALRHAERLGLISITERRQKGARNLPNVVRIVSREWLAWIEHGRKARDRSGIGYKMVHPTDTLGFPRDLERKIKRTATEGARQRHETRAHRSDSNRAL